jgi:hypothetical protein
MTIPNALGRGPPLLSRSLFTPFRSVVVEDRNARFRRFLSLYHLFTEFSQIAFSRMINPPLADQAPQPLAAA